MAFHWSLSDSKSPQVSRTFLSILVVLNNAVVWMVSTRPPTSLSSSPFSNPLFTVPKAPITIGIIIMMVPQSWIINCLKMYKISHETINFIEKNMKNWRVELTAGGKRLAETKIQRGIFQGDALSPLLFLIVMMPLNHILRKCTAGYKLSRSQEKVKYLMYMEDIILFTKKEKELETLIHTIRIYSQDIGMEFCIEKCALLVIKVANDI